MLIEANSLVKNYGSEIKNNVIKNIDLEIDRGQFVLITGKSGSGKSTLLYLLSGLEKPSGGKVLYKGIDLGKLNDRKMSKLRREEIGFIFQFYNLIPVLTVKENILYPIQLDQKPSKDHLSYLDELLSIVDLEDKVDSYPHELSGGQQQRVAIARAMITRPEVIFADEPTGNLDQKNEDQVLKLLKKIVESYNNTVVMVTHDMSHKSFADRVIELNDGKIVS